MKYDFTTILDRKGKDSLAADVIPWEVRPDEGVDPIPMWVADMNFPVAPPIMEAIRARLENPTFGYYSLTDAYYDSIISWQSRRNRVEGLTKEHIGYENGVLGGVSSAVQALTCPGDRILIHSPTYVGFTYVMRDIGRTIVHSPLVRDADGIWRMDYEDMDRKIRENDIKLAIFCSPHNPCGRVWERWEIEKAMQVYADNHCYVISDEIWSDIVMPGYQHIPTQSVSEEAKNRVIAFYAPSKTFSLAGFIGSYHIIYNPWLRQRVEHQGAMTYYNDCNVLSMHTLIGAYSSAGEEWADQMRAVIHGNLSYACDCIERHFPGVRAMRPQGTYMLYLDCGPWLREHHDTIRALGERGVRAGVIWQDGEAFMMPDTIRMNFALPYTRAVEAMERLKTSVFR